MIKPALSIRKFTVKKIEKFFFFLKTEGSVLLLKRLLFYPRECYRNYRLRTILGKSSSAETYFHNVYLDSKERKLESLSGVGSSLAQTTNIRTQLPTILTEYKITSILDAPCGDLRWMREVLKNFNGAYTGIDIVKPLIHNLQNEFISIKNRKFECANIIQTCLPSADLVICRDFLFHLSQADCDRFLSNLFACNFKYLLTTSHPTNPKFVNEDIKTGGFRKINLFLSPYYFSCNFLLAIDDYVPPEERKQMILWKKSEISRTVLK